MRSTVLFLGLPALSLAFPSSIGAGSKDDILTDLLEQKQVEAESEQQEVEKRQGLLGSLLGDVSGLLGSLATSVEPDNKRPEPGYEFQAPGPNDSRGPCPGLNLLANHGYLPRNGYVNFGEVVEASARGFNMGTDLGAILSAIATVMDGNLTTQSFWLGTGDDHVGGLNRHSTSEADVSPNREDYYSGCGDNHHLSSRRFKQNVEFVKQDPNKEFSIDVMGNQYAANAQFSKENNPYVYFFPVPSLVAMGAHTFYSHFFANGTYGDGGVANFESISSIVGAKLSEETGEYEYVPERFPENWYRRSTPFGAVQAFAEALLYIYPKNPIGMPFGQLGTDNLDAQTILCTLKQTLGSLTPLGLKGPVDNLEGIVSNLVGSLADLGLSDTVLGCPADSISPNFATSNDTAEGGPLNPPPAVFANTGNNVYNKVYFSDAPYTPQCPGS